MKPFSTFLGLSLGLFILFVTGCTDATRGKLFAYGGKASIKCYSGAKLIYEGRSTGKVSSSEQSDGYYFVDAADGKLKEVSGNCIITYIEY